MSNYTWQYIQKHPKETKRLLGINAQQLELLIQHGEVWHQKKQEEISQRKIRVNQPGGGRSSQLSIEEQIVLTLIYLRHHLTFQVLGLMFEVSESTANNVFTYWQNLFRENLPSSLLEQAKKEGENLEALLEDLAEYELIVDSGEQSRERPSDYQQQKECYSGKKKEHTFKNQFIVLPLATDIVDVEVGFPGPKSDINLCRKVLHKFHPLQKFSGDKAYLGEAQIRVPLKKPKNGELNQKQKEENKKLSSVRIFVEHLIRLVKVFKVAQERFRLNKRRYSSVLLTVCALVRLRISALLLGSVNREDESSEIEIFTSHSFGCKFNFDG
jgi:hypothetical protein